MLLPRRSTTSSLHALLYSPLSVDADEVVGAYAFSATLAIQDITGDAHSGVTASHLAKRLEGSTESEAYLFALTDVRAPRPLGARGYPELHASDLADISAWVFISLPLLEDTGVIEATITLDAAIAPLPGEPVPREPWEQALSLIDDLSTTTARPIRHLWDTHAPAADSPAADILAAAGYRPAYRETQSTFALDLLDSLDFLGAPEPVPPAITVVRNMNFAPGDLAGFRSLITAASRHYPRGELALDTVEWTEERVRDASARLRDRGGNQLTAIARAHDTHGAHDTIIGMAEAVHYDVDDDTLMELGLIYVLPEYRGRGTATQLVRAVLAAAREQWPDVETCYVSSPAGAPDTAGAETISASTAWQKLS